MIAGVDDSDLHSWSRMVYNDITLNRMAYKKEITES